MMAISHGILPHLLPPNYKGAISAWLEEDCPSFDYGGFVVGEATAEAQLLGKSAGIVAGVPFFDEVFRQLDCTYDRRLYLCLLFSLFGIPSPTLYVVIDNLSPSAIADSTSGTSVEWYHPEGHYIEANTRTHIATVRGPCRKILFGERVALNTLARCSGVATKSAHLLSLVRKAGYNNILSGTRKTTPGFRLVEKYGMLIGGCDAHRMDLSAMTMLKDNHVTAAGSISGAVAAAKAAGGFAVKVEVECLNELEADEAIEAGADVVMLDNFTAEGVKIAARSLKERWKGTRQFLVEVSGGLTEDNVEHYVSQDVDVISTSSIHQGVPHVDFSLKIMKEP
ncbi:MAG: hypothetical protein Q9217_000255 [Psora testacea]